MKQNLNENSKQNIYLQKTTCANIPQKSKYYESVNLARVAECHTSRTKTNLRATIYTHWV